MKKVLNKNFVYLILISLLFLMLVVYKIITENKIKSTLYFKHNDKINELITYNSYFNDFLTGQKDFIIFDSINKKINTFDNIISNLLLDTKKIDFNENYIVMLKKLRSQISNKELWIERFKARKSFESKILFFIVNKSSDENLGLDEDTRKKLNELRLELVKIINTKRTFDDDLIAKYRLDKSNEYINSLFKQIEALRLNLSFQKKYLDTATNPQIEKSLNSVKKILLNQRVETRKLFFLVLNSLVVLVSFFTLILIYFFAVLSKAKDELAAFKKAVENSDNVIVMTDKNSNIIFANDSFTNVSGYSKEDALGKKPSVLKSGIQDESFYKDLNETISKGKTWKGRFINKKKNGELFYENATITPIFTDNKINGYLAIKLDVTESVLHTQKLDELNKSLKQRVDEGIAKLREKDNLILNQTKMSALGEMIGNIAHQWRQPLSVISTSATSMLLQNSLKTLDENAINDYGNTINKNVQYLSKTIDDFRDFIQGNSKKEKFNLKESIDSFLSLVEASIKKYEINIIVDVPNDIVINNLKNELSQCLINLFNNSKDVMLINNIKQKYIKITVNKKDNGINLLFHDSGGGIPKEVIDKIFEPYFTTKHKSMGTGLGLSMVYKIVTKGMGGTILPSNKALKVNNNELFGACFSIKLPL